MDSFNYIKNLSSKTGLKQSIHVVLFISLIFLYWICILIGL